jgi:hypothetical protein
MLKNQPFGFTPSHKSSFRTPRNTKRNKPHIFSNKLLQPVLKKSNIPLKYREQQLETTTTEKEPEAGRHVALIQVKDTNAEMKHIYRK